ncbi:MAG: phenylalanine--tRNA ligase subunit alpha [Deltaproteobacteria bacterium]|nr:MAG: phenylalanine--tRNA ligase subunit alpha [Deltaproteobacteria bacterium]
MTSRTSQELAELEREAVEAIEAADSLPRLLEARSQVLGRKGTITESLRGIGAADPADRARLGRELNLAKQRIEARFADRRAALEAGARERELREHRLDVTLPGTGLRSGHLHPVTQLEREMVAFFTGLGFSIEDGPQVETDYNNFEALNFPPDHPARDMQDTFYVEGGNLLRTHTSPVQIRAMQRLEPPFRFVVTGRVYRHDFGPRSSPMFHQIEGVMVDERTSFGDLKGILYAFARQLFGARVDLRFRASYFPFTEPSAEFDVTCPNCAGAGCGTCSQSGWIEWGGCGMVHPRVLENCQIDAERYQGFAFGMGIDRAAMIRFGLPSIHVLFEPDARILEQI